MKILVCHVAYRQPGGEDVVFENEKILLQEAGVEVVSVLLHNDSINDSTWAGRLHAGIETIWSRRGYQYIADILQREQPDIVHFHNIFPLLSPSAYLACRDAGTPVIQTLHNFRLICAGATLFTKGDVCERCIRRIPMPALYYRCYRDSYMATAAVASMQIFHRLIGTFKNHVSRYLVLTTFAKSRLVRGGLPESRIIIKPNFLMAPPESNIEVGDYALFIGRMTEDKGIGMLLDAWAEINSLPLLVAGDGPLYADMQQKIAVKSGKAHMLGHQSKEKVQSLLAAAAFIIIPSVCYEGFPIVLLEAFASGKPVLCSRLGGLDELVSENVTGKKFNAGDSADLVNIVNKLILDKESLERMGRAAREEFNLKYTATVATKELLDIYENVLTGKHDY